MLQYHHCRTLESVVYGKIKAVPEHADEGFKDAYSWLENEVGFFPVFLSVGITNKDIQMTGYQNQWGRILPDYIREEDRKKSSFPNYVLFSFEEVNGIFMDYQYWHLVLNARYKNYQMTDYEKRLIFKPSWSKSKWLRKAKKEPCSVQLVTPKLYLPDAKRIWMRNQQTKRLLTSMGFDNIKSRRLLIED